MRYLFASAAPLLLARRWKGVVGGALRSRLKPGPTPGATARQSKDKSKSHGWALMSRLKPGPTPGATAKAEQRQEQKPWVGFDVQAEAWTYPRCNGKGRAKAKAKARGRSSAARR